MLNDHQHSLFQETHSHTTSQQNEVGTLNFLNIRSSAGLSDDFDDSNKGKQKENIKANL